MTTLTQQFHIAAARTVCGIVEERLLRTGRPGR
jgi:hypothetical protein